MKREPIFFACSGVDGERENVYDFFSQFMS